MRIRVRRLTLTRKDPTRHGDTALHILSHVPVHRASAPHLARLSGTRWSLETALWEITTPLSCAIKTLGYPKAAVLALCLALVADNAGARIQAALRRVHGRQQSQDEVASSSLS